MIDWTYMPIAILARFFRQTLLPSATARLLPVLQSVFTLHLIMCGDTNSDVVIFTNEYTSSLSSSSSSSSLLLLWLAALADFYGTLSIIKHINIPNTADHMPIIPSIIVSERTRECVCVCDLDQHVCTNAPPFVHQTDKLSQFFFSLSLYLILFLSSDVVVHYRSCTPLCLLPMCVCWVTIK